MKMVNEKINSFIGQHNLWYAKCNLYTPPSFVLSLERNEIKKTMEEFIKNRIQCIFLSLFKLVYIIVPTHYQFL